MTTMPDAAEQPHLPPFSGRDSACPKCGDAHVETRWLVKPVGRAQDHVPRTEEAAARAQWFALYWIGGSWDAARGAIVTLGGAAWYPGEWLGRHCVFCKFRWDEAIAEAEAERA